MVVAFGYCVVLASGYFLYLGHLLPGGLLFLFGGWLAGGLKLRLRSLGVVLLVGAIAVGFHHGVSLPVVIAGVVGFLMANSRRRHRRGRDGDDGWGFDIDFSDFSDFGGGGDGGCDGGGGGD